LNFLKLIMLIAFTSLSCIKSTGLPGDFINLNFPAEDIGVGSEGDVCVAGIDKKVYCFDFMEVDWIRIETKDLVKITRIDVNADGTIYVISICGIYYLDCENRWVKLPGSANDIGVGVDGTVWKVGTDEYDIVKPAVSASTGVAGSEEETFTNYGIWRLFCDCDCLCICTRLCIRFRPRYIDPCTSIIAPKCYWFRVDGYGINIDVMPNGDAVFTVNHWQASYTTVKTVNHHGLYLRDYLCGDNSANNKFGFLADDITVGNTGVVYVTRRSTNSGNNGKVYKCHRNNEWKEVEMKGVGTCLGVRYYARRISAGPYNQLWFIHKNIGTSTGGNCSQAYRSNKVHTSSQFKFIYTIPKLIVFKPKSAEGALPVAPAAK